MKMSLTQALRAGIASDLAPLNFQLCFQLNTRIARRNPQQVKQMRFLLNNHQSVLLNYI